MMNNLEKLIELADKPLLTYGRTKVSDFKNGIFSIKIGSIFKKTIEFNLTNNTVTLKKKTYELKDKSPRINVDGDFEIILNIGGKDVIVYCVDKKYKSIADDMLTTFTDILNNGVSGLADDNISKESSIKNPLLWLHMTGFMSNNKFKVDFENGLILIDMGVVKNVPLTFDIIQKNITYKEQSYKFSEVISIKKNNIDIIFTFNDSKEISVYFECLNNKIDNSIIESFRSNVLQCFETVIYNDNFAIPKQEDSLVYIDETLEPYQKWINSVDVIVCDAQLANTSFFMDSSSAFVMKVADFFNSGISADGFLDFEKVENLRLLDILFYSRSLKGALLTNKKLTIENYWKYKRELFKIVQKRFTSFEELSKIYLEERKELFTSNSNGFKHKLDDGENNFEEEQKEKEKLVKNLLTNKLSVWNELGYNFEL